MSNWSGNPDYVTLQLINTVAHHPLLLFSTWYWQLPKVIYFVKEIFVFFSLDLFFLFDLPTRFLAVISKRNTKKTCNTGIKGIRGIAGVVKIKGIIVVRNCQNKANYGNCQNKGDWPGGGHLAELAYTRVNKGIWFDPKSLTFITRIETLFRETAPQRVPLTLTNEFDS